MLGIGALVLGVIAIFMALSAVSRANQAESSAEQLALRVRALEERLVVNASVAPAGGNTNVVTSSG